MPLTGRGHQKFGASHSAGLALFSCSWWLAGMRFRRAMTWRVFAGPEPHLSLPFDAPDGARASKKVGALHSRVHSSGLALAVFFWGSVVARGRRGPPIFAVDLVCVGSRRGVRKDKNGVRARTPFSTFWRGIPARSSHAAGLSGARERSAGLGGARAYSWSDGPSQLHFLRREKLARSGLSS